MRWILYGAVAYVVVFLIALHNGAGTVMVVLAAPWAPLLNLAARLRRTPGFLVDQAFKRLRHDFSQLSPPVVKWHPVGGFPLTEVTVYVVCAREADRPQLEHQLPALTARVHDALRRAAAPESVIDGIKLVSASLEMVEREGGFFAYAHNH
jgi:hypothetical protein